MSDFSNIVIFVGKLIEKKRPLDLARAFHALDKSDCCLVFVGDGNLRKDIEDFTATNHIKNIFVKNHLKVFASQHFLHLLHRVSLPCLQ